MTTGTAVDTSNLTEADDVGTNAASFVRHLRAANLAASTVKTYGEAVDLFHQGFGMRSAKNDAVHLGKAIDAAQHMDFPQGYRL